MNFKNEGETDFFRHSKVERIYHQETYPTINVKESSPGRRKMKPDRNQDLHKRMKNARNDNYMNQ